MNKCALSVKWPNYIEERGYPGLFCTFDSLERALLTRQHSFTEETRYQLKLISGISLGMFLYMLFFLPFEYRELEFNNRLLFIIGLGIIPFLVMWIFRILVFLVGNEPVEQDEACTSPLLAERLPDSGSSREIATREVTVLKSKIGYVVNEVVLAAGGAGSDGKTEGLIFGFRRRIVTSRQPQPRPLGVLREGDDG